MGLNTTGLPNTNDYSLGRGRVYFAPIVVATGLPGAYRFLGNAPEFSISVETEKLEHTSSQAGLKSVDKEVITQQKMNLQLTLDEINFQNLAIFVSGEAAEMGSGENLGMATNAAGVTMYTTVAGEEFLGRWYDIINVATGKRAYNLGPSGAADIGTDITLWLTATEFTAPQYAKITADCVDLNSGRIFIPYDFPTTGLVIGSDTLVIKWAAAISVTLFHEVRAATQTNIKGALKFIGVNPANDDSEREFQFHQVSLKPQGDFSLIGDEWTRMTLTGAAEANVLADPDSPYLTIRD